MKNFLRAIFIFPIAALLVASASIPSGAAGRPSAFDGQWSVVIYTLHGDCDRSLRYSLNIVGGRVQPAEQNYEVAGAVAPNGTVHVTVAEAGRSATGSGRLAGNTGSGTWRTSTGECTGQWTAERRNW
jgi:hypothetical protein